MRVRATLRVRPGSSQGGARPSAERLEEAAAALRAAGLDVVYVGRFGVSVEADESQLAAQLGMRLPLRQNIVAALAPSSPELSRLVDQIEIPTPPASLKTGEEP
jgi:hypothetical protein